MTSFLQATLYGLTSGGLLALVGMGFSLVWGILNVVNLAHGAIALFGAYIAFELHARYGLDPFAAIPICALFLFIAGYLVQRFLINLVVDAQVYVTAVLTFGANLVLIAVSIDLFSADYRTIATSYSSASVALGDVRLPVAQGIGFLVAVILTAALVVLMRMSPWGLAIKATGMDRVGARLMGVKVRHVYALTFGIAAALAGSAGPVLAVSGTFSPADAAKLTLQSFVVAVLGGLGNVGGALAGGLILGVVDSWASLYVSGTWVDIISFGILIAVLIVRPNGLIGRPFYSERLEV